MSNLRRRFLLIIVVGAVYAVGLTIWTRPHWWYRVGTAEVRSPSGLSDPATVYKSVNGELLFVVTADPLRRDYIYFPSSQKIGIPQGFQFTLTPFLAYRHEVPVSVVFSDDKIKVETDMEISVENGKLRFRTPIYRQVEADLNSF